MRLENQIAQKLITNKQTLAVAESCTGGLLAHRLTNVPGSSAFFKLGLITYANEAKQKILGIPGKTLKTHGAVSVQTAKGMAKNVRKMLNTDFGVSITGIAGPANDGTSKPVGLTYIALADRSKVVCREFRFKGTRLKIKQQAVEAALQLILVAGVRHA